MTKCIVRAGCHAREWRSHLADSGPGQPSPSIPLPGLRRRENHRIKLVLPGKHLVFSKFDSTTICGAIRIQPLCWAGSTINCWMTITRQPKHHNDLQWPGSCSRSLALTSQELLLGLSHKPSGRFQRYPPSQMLLPNWQWSSR